MQNVSILELLDEQQCQAWLERYLHPQGLRCPHCRSTNRRVFRQQQHFAAYRCRDCNGYYTALTGTVFARTQQSAATLVLLLWGITRRVSTTSLARELGMTRQQVLVLRQRIEAQ